MKDALMAVFFTAVVLGVGCAVPPHAPSADCDRLATKMFSVRQCAQMDNCRLVPADIEAFLDATVQAKAGCGYVAPLAPVSVAKPHAIT